MQKIVTISDLDRILVQTILWALSFLEKREVAQKRHGTEQKEIRKEHGKGMEEGGPFLAVFGTLWPHRLKMLCVPLPLLFCCLVVCLFFRKFLFLLFYSRRFMRCSSGSLSRVEPGLKHNMKQCSSWNRSCYFKYLWKMFETFSVTCLKYQNGWREKLGDRRFESAEEHNHSGVC